MTYVLIASVWFAGSVGYNVTTQEFTSKQTCLVAAETLKKQLVGGRAYYIDCVEK